MSSEWGLSRWGLSGWGIVGPLTLDEAYPLGPRNIYVRFSIAPQAASPVSFGDVQRRATWELKRTDTGERIEVIGATRLNMPEEYRLMLLSPLGPSAVTHTLKCPTLRSAALAPIGFPFSATFLGVDEVKPVTGRASREPKVVDLRSDSFFGRGTAIRPDAGGGYELQSGESGLRKRLFRILDTQPGQHPADPTFGCALQIKELLRDPAGQRAVIEAQVLRDPEVAGASVSLELLDEGIAYVTIKARMTTGAEADETFRVDSGGVRYGRDA